MSDLNLLPSQAKFQAQKIHLKKIINNSIWVLGGFWLLLVVIVFGSFLISKLRLDQVNKKYERSQAQYRALSEDMVINQRMKYQAKVVAKVLQERFEYGKSMDMLNNLFSEKVSVDKLVIDESKKFVLEGSIIGNKDISEVEEMVNKINRGDFESLDSAKLTKVELKPQKWVFAMEVKVK